MSNRGRRPPTYQDVLDAPEHMVAEIVGGELFVLPRPAPEHAFTAGQIGIDVDVPFHRGRGGPGGWWILPEPELHLGSPDPTAVVAAPDLAGWRTARMPNIPDTAAITLPPDWVCEIVSPGAKTNRRDRVLKPHEYATAGVPWLWLVDPLGEILEVFELREGVYARILACGGDDRVRAKPFDAVELDLSAWWVRRPS